MNRPILAIITVKTDCISVINTAKFIAEKQNRKLCVLAVLPRKEEASVRSETLKFLKAISQTLDVDIVIRYSNNLAISAAAHAKQCNPVHIFLENDNMFLENFMAIYNSAPISVVSNSFVITRSIKGA